MKTIGDYIPTGPFKNWPRELKADLKLNPQVDGAAWYEHKAGLLASLLANYRLDTSEDRDWAAADAAHGVVDSSHMVQNVWLAHNTEHLFAWLFCESPIKDEATFYNAIRGAQRMVLQKMAHILISYAYKKHKREE